MVDISDIRTPLAHCPGRAISAGNLSRKSKHRMHRKIHFLLLVFVIYLFLPFFFSFHRNKLLLD